MIWREDASNSDTTYLRNRIRHQLLPLLEGYNPAIRSCLAATASVLGGDEALLEELTEQAFTGSCLMGRGRIVCSIGQLLVLNPALRRRVLRHAFKQLTGTLEGMSQRHIDAICTMTDSDRPNSRLALPQGVTAVREYDRLVWMRTDEAELRLRSATDLENEYELVITEPGSYQLPCGGSVTVDIRPARQAFRPIPAPPVSTSTQPRSPGWSAPSAPATA